LRHLLINGKECLLKHTHTQKKKTPPFLWKRKRPGKKDVMHGLIQSFLADKSADKLPITLNAFNLLSIRSTLSKHAERFNRYLFSPLVGTFLIPVHPL